MESDATACGQIIIACDYWLKVKKIQNPPNFYREIESIKREADGAKYDPVRLQEVKQRLVVLTNGLTDEHKKVYQDMRTASEKEALVVTSRLRNRVKRTR